MQIEVRDPPNHPKTAKLLNIVQNQGKKPPKPSKNSKAPKLIFLKIKARLE
jgi:hypothetical protein